MKKNLIALAVLAASGASFAQVTMYGIADGGWQAKKTSTTASGVTTDTREDGVVSSGLSTGRFGFKGTEDIGGGLKAEFNLEGEVAIADGSQAGGNLFGRTSTIGLSGGFGLVRLGLAQTPMFAVLAVADVFGATVQPAVVRLNPAVGTRAPNAVHYTTPALGGFEFRAMYGNSDTGTSSPTPAPNTTRNQGLSVGYAAGPMSVALGWGSNETTATTSVSARSDGMALSGGYDFGAVKLVAGFTTGKVQSDLSLDTYTVNTETNVGVSVPLGAITLLANLGRNTRTQTTTGAELATNTGSGNDWIIGGTYALSKRTTAYVKTGVYNKFAFGASANGTSNSTEISASIIGLRHTF